VSDPALRALAQAVRDLRDQFIMEHGDRFSRFTVERTPRTFLMSDCVPAKPRPRVLVRRDMGGFFQPAWVDRPLLRVPKRDQRPTPCASAESLVEELNRRWSRAL
jgi:hypothetical protein